MSEPSIARGMRPNRHPLDEDSASRLLKGLVHPDDAPPGYGAVAGLLHSAAQLPLGPVDEDAAATTVSAMVEAIRGAAPAPQPSRRKTMLGKLLAGKALAAVAVLGLTATGAAAATGTLPDPAQGVVSDAVSHVGVNIPHPNHGKSADHRQDGEHKPSGDDHGQSGDDHGQSGDDHGQSGDETKGMSGTVADLKANRPADAGPLGQDVCAVASDGKCRSGENHKGNDSGDESTPPSSGPSENHSGGQENGDDHGKPEVTPPTTPTSGSIATGSEHSGRDLPSGNGKPESNG
jgi:hypothetical protein